MEQEKSEFTTVISKSDTNNSVRTAVNSSEYDEYRETWNEVTNLNKITDFPTQLDFELNYSCNFTCPMCTWNAESTDGNSNDTWFDFEVFNFKIILNVLYLFVHVFCLYHQLFYKHHRDEY